MYTLPCGCGQMFIAINFLDISQLTIQEEGYAVYEGLQQSLEDKDDEGSDQSVNISCYPNITSSSFLSEHGGPAIQTFGAFSS